MELPTRIRAIRDNGRTVVAVLIRNADIRASATAGTGYFSRLKFEIGDTCVAEAFTGPQAATNPLVKFDIDELEPGTPLAVSWEDNQGHRGFARTTVN